MAGPSPRGSRDQSRRQCLGAADVRWNPGPMIVIERVTVTRLRIAGHRNGNFVELPRILRRRPNYTT